MTHRSFNDDTGQAWEVWDVFPARVRLWLDAERARQADNEVPARKSALEDSVPDAMRDGWLAFHCDTETRRLAPIPGIWPAASEGELILLLGKARRTSRVADSSGARQQPPQTQLPQTQL